MRDNFSRYALQLRQPQLVKIWLTYVTKWVATEEELAQLGVFETTVRKELEAMRLVDYLREQRVSIRSNIDFNYQHAGRVISYLEGWRGRQEDGAEGGG